MWLETTTAEQKRIAYDSMTLLGDIGGLYDFIVIFVISCQHSLRNSTDLFVVKSPTDLDGTTLLIVILVPRILITSTVKCSDADSSFPGKQKSLWNSGTVRSSSPCFI